MSDIQSTRERLAKYCTGFGIDIGFGNNPIVPHAINIDIPQQNIQEKQSYINLAGDAHNLYWFKDCVFDFVFSAYLLENYNHDEIQPIILEWLRILKVNGNLILLLSKNMGFEYIRSIITNIPEIILIHNNPEIEEYSFELAIKKTGIIPIKHYPFGSMPGIKYDPVQEKMDKALQYHQTGKLQEAENLYRQILEFKPDNAETLHLLGVIAYQSNKFDDAIDQINNAIKITPSSRYYNNLGLAYRKNNNVEKAIESYKKAIEIDPGFVEAFNNLGVAYSSNNELDKSIESYKKSIELNPNHADAYYNLGNAYRTKGEYDETIICYEKTLKLKPGFKDVIFNIGNIYSTKGDFDKALECYGKALEFDPKSFEVQHNIANAYRHKNDYDKAIEHYKNAVELKPDHIEGYHDIGVMYATKGDAEEAVNWYMKTIELKPDHVDAYNNLGAAYTAIGDIAKAIPNYLTAIEYKPDYPEAYNNLGVACRWNNELDRAIEYLYKSLELKPDYIEAKYNLGYMLLLKKDFEKGLEYYEQRLYKKIKNHRAVDTDKPEWYGKTDINGKTVYVSAEQGIGDTIQFVRYLPILHSMGANVILKPHAGLEELLRSSDLKAEIVDNSKKTEDIEFDTFCYLMSLPYFFKANIDNIPSKSKYLNADNDRIAQYKQEYFDNNDFKIGIFWQGNTSHKNDKNRSMPLSYFHCLKDLPNTKIYSLQKGFGIEQLQNKPEDMDIINLGEIFKDFTDTAAAVENLDLIIGIDTALIHLACALEKPTWMLIPWVPDWRWGYDMDYSYWYDSMKIYRQKEAGNWEELMERVMSDLNSRLELHKSFQHSFSS